MFVLVGAKLIGNIQLFAIKDTTDGVVDIVERDMLVSFLRVGLKIEGVTPNKDLTDFTYSEANFIVDDTSSESSNYDSDEDDSDEDDDYYDDEDEDDDDYYDDEDEDDDDYDEDDEDYDEDDEDDDEYEDDDVYYGYDDEDEDDEEESTVSKLYSYLTKEQVKTLQAYYLWYSQNIFKAAQKDPTLNMKDANRRAQKVANLNSLRNTGGLWHYAGFIDTGYDGGGCCTLGHKLRYMHLAWDVTVSDIETAFWGNDFNVDIDTIIQSNNCIIFGIKCITDFFEVDSDCMSNLLKAQRQSMKEMEYLCSLYEEGSVDSVKSQFKLFDDLMDIIVLKCNKAKLLGTEPMVLDGLAQFYTRFKEVGLLYPKSLVQQVRDSLVGWTSHKFTGCVNISTSMLQKTFVNLYGKKVNAIFDFYSNNTYFTKSYYVFSDYISALRQYFELFFYREICGAYAYDPNSKLFKDEGGGSQKAKDWLKLRVKILGDSFFSDYEFSMEFLNKVVNLTLRYIGVFNKLKSVLCYYTCELDTEKQEYIIKENTLDYSTGYLSVNVRDKVDDVIRRCYSSLVKGALLPIWKDFNKTGGTDLADAENEVQLLEDYINTELPKSMLSFRSDVESQVEGLNNKLLESINSKKEKEARDEALDKEKQESSQNNIDKAKIISACVNALHNKALLDKLNNANDFYAKVIKTVSRTNTATDKQMYYLSKAYEVITGNKVNLVSSDKLLLAEHQEIALDIAKIQKREKELRDKLGDNAQKTLDIMSSILKYGAASQRQLKYVNQAKELLGIN